MIYSFSAVIQLILVFFGLVGVLGATITKVELVQIFVEGHLGRTAADMGATSTPRSSVSSTVATTWSGTASAGDNELYRSIYNYHGPYDFNETFSREVATAHNEKRALHGAQMMHWNNTVFEYAADYARKYDCSGVLKHSGGRYGENLAVGYTTTGAINAWYDEGSTYIYGTESTYNHFTALIWNGSSSVGCAYKYCNDVWGTYLVCSYYPAGNIIGQSSQNVFPLL